MKPTKLVAHKIIIGHPTSHAKIFGIRSLLRPGIGLDRRRARALRFSIIIRGCMLLKFPANLAAPDNRLRPGNPAEMVVLGASSAHKAMARLPVERAAWHQGKLIHVHGLTRRSALS